ncbi:MAG: hypothetical protein V2I48_04820 [Xanthomonadales bacterium]|jgi:Spy/CpxP family protein refolding chaperone|nr:hypothetical protein [Xanthomonadales bacterium]
MTTRFSKSILILAASGLLSAGSAFAGNGPGGGDCDGTGDGACKASGGGNGGAQRQRGGAAERMAGMANRLGLTIEQQVRALELFDAHNQERAQIQARIFEDYGVEICNQRATHREEFLALLTPEQLALHEEMKNRRGKRAGGGGFGGGFECPEPVED